MKLKYLNKINPIYFLIGFAIGMCFVYVTQAPKKVIYKHPTPDNAGRVVYHDKENNCYKYVATEIKCPSDSNMAVSHPLVLE